MAQTLWCDKLTSFPEIFANFLFVGHTGYTDFLKLKHLFSDKILTLKLTMVLGWFLRQDWRSSQNSHQTFDGDSDDDYDGGDESSSGDS